ncbi:MAG: hypothetical protein M0R80_08205 [Proteobacteria bacterium]|jgi:hypothetical protein|nr:hypothetical protein [Pseudomonadota bacterium]
MANDTFVFSDYQLQVLTGSLLGDGHLTKVKYGSPSFSKSQATKRIEYLNWHFGIFGSIASSVKTCQNWAKGKQYSKSKFYTKTHPHLAELRKIWYPKGVKIVPHNITLTPLAVAIWFFDDGTNNLKNRCVKFATYSFNRDDCNFLVSQLSQMGFKSTVCKDNVIRVRTESYKALIDMVKPYMLWNCFAHKILYREASRKYISDEEAIKIFEDYNSGMKQKDIAVKFKTDPSTVSAILRGKRKKHLKLVDTISLPLNNKSGYKHVFWEKHSGKWRVHIIKKGKTLYYENFADKMDAVAARDRWLEESSCVG